MAEYHKATTPKTGKAINPLPQLSVDLVGEVRGTNLAAYKESAIAFIESINTDLQTEQDFADAESVVKFCNKQSLSPGTWIR
jgi:hypothetical protein